MFRLFFITICIACFALLATKSVAEPMSFRRMTSGGNCETCSWIAADGVIEIDTAQKLEAFLGYDGSSPMRGMRIHLNSPGGDLIGGLLLGRSIREMELNTAISTSLTEEIWGNGLHKAAPEADPTSQCSSACSLAFAGGVVRYASTSHSGTHNVGFRDLGRLGVHQFYDPLTIHTPEALTRTANDARNDQVLIAQLLQHLDQMGVSSELLQLASKTLPQDMHYLSEDELLSTRSDNASVQDLQIRGYKNGVAIIEIQFSRNDADYVVEMFCENNQMKMLASVEWHSGYDISGHQDWNLLSGITIPNPTGGNAIRVRKIREEWLSTSTSDTLGKFTFVFEGAPMIDLVRLKRFAFSDWSSRHAAESAAGFSFTLPDSFDGLYLLPNTCL
jgi:hypothetical protein